MANPEISEEKFRERINQSPNQWGKAFLTEVEWRNICQAKGNSSWGNVCYIRLPRGEIPPPVITDENDVLLDTDGFIDLVVSDACPLAYNLILFQGRTAESLVWSYTMKSRAFRFIAREIENEELKERWRGSEIKREGEIGVLELMKPEGISSNELVGKEKVACYLPCQLLKDIEAIRTGRSELLDPMFKEPIELSDEERELLKIPWEMYREAIIKSESIEDIAANIAIETFKILHEKGLDEEKIISLLFQGYSPRGPLLEQGQRDKITQIWGSIARQVDMNYDIHLWQKFETVINRAIDEYNEKAESLGIPPLNPYIKL